MKTIPEQTPRRPQLRRKLLHSGREFSGCCSGFRSSSPRTLLPCLVSTVRVLFPRRSSSFCFRQCWHSMVIDWLSHAHELRPSTYRASALREPAFHSSLHVFPSLLDCFSPSTRSEHDSEMTATPIRCGDSPSGADRAPVTEPAPTFAPAGSAPVTRSAWVTRRSDPLFALEKKKLTLKASRQPKGL